MCEFCPEFCTACNWDAGITDVVCTACDSGYKTYDGGCVSNCPSTFYLDGETCVSCEDANCDTCSGAGTGVCTSCSDTYLLRTDSTCDTTCHTDEYDPADGTNICSSCPDNCLTCTSDTSCDTCEATYVL
jgi:proprotein convertase subtilisin/kexin type 5